MIKVFKFGGASVRDAAAVRNVAAIVKRHVAGNRLLIVVSAMGKTTNALEHLYDTHVRSGATDVSAEARAQVAALKAFHLEIARELFGDDRHPVFALLDNVFARLAADAAAQAGVTNYDQGYDQIVSYGEIISSHIVAHLLAHEGLPARWIDARQYIQTDTTWREARVDWPWTERQVQRRLLPLLDEHVLLTQGFIGGTVDGRTTTLGREGSDFTAAVYAYALPAASVTIWKDVPGILNGDPKRVRQTYLYPQLSYEQAAEMTYYGATVIHPKTIRPLKSRGIPLYVRSFLDADAPGTCISTEAPEQMRPAIIFKPRQRVVSFGVRDLTFVSEHNLFDILNAVARLNLRINLMQNSAISYLVSFDDHPRKLPELLDILREQFEIEVSDEMLLITIKHYDLPTIEQIMWGRRVAVEQNTGYTYQAVVPVSDKTTGNAAIPLFDWKPIG
ncbi:MAG: aspartate kinase [Catalinimonas sp.]